MGRIGGDAEHLTHGHFTVTVMERELLFDLKSEAVRGGNGLSPYELFNGKALSLSVSLLRLKDTVQPLSQRLEGLSPVLLNRL
jgi:hypothetical protein